MKIPQTKSSEIPGTKTTHNIHYFEGAAELRNTTKHVVKVECLLHRECNIFTRSGHDTVFQDGEIIGHLSCPPHTDLVPFISNEGVATTIHLSNGGTLIVRLLESNGAVRCRPL